MTDMEKVISIMAQRELVQTKPYTKTEEITVVNGEQTRRTVRVENAEVVISHPLDSYRVTMLFDESGKYVGIRVGQEF